MTIAEMALMKGALAWERFVLTKVGPGLKTFGNYAKVQEGLGLQSRLQEQLEQCPLVGFVMDTFWVVCYKPCYRAGGADPPWPRRHGWPREGRRRPGG